jgi:hypothetical protein
MEQIPQYIRISDLVTTVKRMHRPIDSAIKCQHATSLIKEIFLSIATMTNSEREDMMKLLTGWMLSEKFGPESRPALIGLQKYCIAECLFADPHWNPPSN